MISEETLEGLHLFMLGTTDYRYKDVLVDGREHTAVLWDGRWYLHRINFKFGDGIHRGFAYLEGDPKLINVVELEYLDSLPVWESTPETGAGGPTEVNPPAEPAGDNPP